MNNAPTPSERADAMAKIAEQGIATYVTIEPIMDFDLDEFVALIKKCKPEQVNIGAESKHQVQIPQPSNGNKLLMLILNILCFSKVKVKKNLNGHLLTEHLVNYLKSHYDYEKQLEN